jgi:hypothetical protein
LIAWSQSGILAAVLMLAFVLLFLYWTFQAGRHIDAEISNLGKGIFFGALWFWLQAQGENFGILGEQHVTPLLGLCTGVLFGLLQAHRRPTLIASGKRQGIQS